MKVIAAGLITVLFTVGLQASGVSNDMAMVVGSGFGVIIGILIGSL